MRNSRRRSAQWIRIGVYPTHAAMLRRLFCERGYAAHVGWACCAAREVGWTWCSLVTVTLVRDFCAPVSELDPLPSINPLDFVGLKGDDTPWGVGNSSVSRPPRA